MNCENLLTAKSISSYVKDKYFNLPMTWRYRVSSTKGEPSYNESEVVELIGVEIELYSDILNVVNTSDMYFT